ncbi:pyridoxal-phosphate-dependent aminotransferase family protein [Oceanithermus desulfurans]
MAVTRLRLLTPGPVNLHPAALQALTRPQLHHRSPEATAIVRALRKRLAELLGTRGEALLVGGSGTAAMEAVVRALFRPGARVWVPVAGKFAERWAEIARAAGLEPQVSEHPWGAVVGPDDLPPGRLDGALLTHSETSTGVLHPVRELAAAVRARSPEALVVVDAVTSFLVAELELEAWGLDAAVSGSQKGAMAPPGLAFAWLAPRALERLRPSGYYLDLSRELTAQRRGQTAFTPPIQIIEAVHDVLKAAWPQGRDDLARHWAAKREANARFYARGAELGLRPVPAREEARSPATAAFYLPEGWTAGDLAAAFAERGWRVAGGQGPLKGRIFRVSAMGYFTRAELERAYGDFTAVLRRS